MSTCKDCLHYDVCKKLSGYTEEFITSCEKNFEKYGDAKEKCECFKDRSKFIELPCKVGDTVYTIVSGKVKENEVTSVCFINTLNFSSFEFHVRNFRGASLLYTGERLSKTVFLTKEEAEQALTRGVQNDEI